MNKRNNEIPPITDLMGQHWKQPSTSEILIDDTHALMAQRTYDALASYDTTFPSGVYPGKMWKRREPKRTLLVWFGIHSDPRFCTNNFREILIA